MLKPKTQFISVKNILFVFSKSPVFYIFFPENKAKCIRFELNRFFLKNKAVDIEASILLRTKPMFF